MPQAEENKSAQSEKTKKAQQEFEKEFQIEQLLNFELGFSRVMEAIAKSKKPIIGHNMKFDLAFLYHQFFKEMPDTYEKFANSMTSEFLREVFDTKVFSLHAGKLGKSDL